MTHWRPAWSAPFAVASIQPVAPLLPFGAVDPHWAWGGSTGGGVKVAVIDSGIDADHPALHGRVQGFVSIRQDPSATGTPGVVLDHEPHGDDAWHGTVCASIIRRLAPECELFSVKVLGPALTGRASALAAGLRWAIDQSMHVVNLSLGTAKRQHFAALHELADEAYFRNVVLVTAANNQATASAPSLCASVISVGSHDVPDPFRIYANPRPPIEFGAWGIDVQVPDRDADWTRSSGNSLAAPHMAGIAARILAKHPGLTVFQLKTLLWQLAANACAPS
jgi:subtilisin family serine protease